MGFAVLRFEKVKTTRVLNKRVMHNRREGMIPKHIDQTRSHSNEVEGNALAEFHRMTEGVKMRKNGVLAVEAVVSFSHSMIGAIDIAKWKQTNLAWFRERFGEDNILETSLHLDEKTPHMHILFAPRIRGKWNCREILGGKKKLAKLQDYYAEVMKPFGLQRGRKRKGRRHVPPAEYREIQEGRIQDRKQISSELKSYLGQEGYHKFLLFIKDKRKRNKEVKDLEKKVLEGKPETVQTKKAKKVYPSEPSM